MLRSGARYHNSIPLAECEDRDSTLYFRGKRYCHRSDSGYQIIDVPGFNPNAGAPA